MTALVWQTDDLELGLDRGVLYTATAAYPWNGLSSLTENPEAEIFSDFYYDGIRYLVLAGTEDFNLTVDAFTYPKEFEILDGLNWIVDDQPRGKFGFSYRNKHKDGHMIHLVWGAIAQAVPKQWSTINNELEISMFSWEFTTTPKSLISFKPTSHIIVDTTLAAPAAISELEALIYGTVSTSPTLPDPQAVLDLFVDYAQFVVTDNGDGTATIVGPSSAIAAIDANSYSITWPSVIYISSTTVNMNTF